MTGIDANFAHERVEIFHDQATGATGVIAVHSTAIGPAMGGLRLHAYDSLDDATVDALRLSRAMSLKNAAAGLDLGGGKAVLLDDGGWSSPPERAARMAAVGRHVDALAGQYITAEDVGTTPRDMDDIARATRWVAGRSVERGGRGDPSPATARTVFGAIEAAVRLRLGVDGLDGVTVGVQGVGHVGAALAGALSEAGALVTITDARPERAAAVAVRHDLHVEAPTDFVRGDFDVLAPCALGESISLDDVGHLRCSIVAGAANNPLASAPVATELDRLEILYVPDFLANCGGIIHVGAEALQLPEAEAERLIVASIARTAELLADADARRRLPWDVAVEFAQTRRASAAAATAVEVS